MDNKLKIHVLNTGYSEVDESLFYKDESLNPLAFTGLFRNKEHKIKAPIFSFLIEHPKGNVLVDTGWSKLVRENYKKHLPRKVYLASKPILPPGHDILEQLDKLGIHRLQFALLTHMHVDHVDALNEIKDMTEFILVSRDELKSANKGGGRYVKELWEDVIFDRFNWNGEMGPYFKSYDLFRDDKINLIYLPGHTMGSTGVLIKNNNKFAFITGDAAYTKESWQQLKLPAIVNDKDRTMRCLKYIHKLGNSEKCVEILTSHDPSIQPHVLEF